MGDLSIRYPDAEFRILATSTAGESGVGYIAISGSELEEITQYLADPDRWIGLVAITGAEQDALLPDLRGYEAVLDSEVLQANDDRLLVQVETVQPPLPSPIWKSGVPFQMPLIIADRQLTLEITAPYDRISELTDHLNTLEIPFEVHHVHQQVDFDRLLTDKQTELMEAAIERGYYDTPRKCTLAELAEDLDRAQSTCSEMLHRAEGKIIKEFFPNRNGVLD